MEENKQEEVTSQEAKNEEKVGVKNKSILPIIIVVIIFGTIAIFGGIALGTYLLDNYEEKEETTSSEVEECSADNFKYIDILKPVIYIYPEEETEVTVKLGKPSLLTCTYPKYDENTWWKVMAKPDGTLIDKETGREYYSLYWEGKKDIEANMTEGFVVRGEDTVKFLEEKLEILGLTEKEAQEFIIYWLPQMENNKYNLIRFETKEEIEENMPLEIVPAPDTIIRVMMDWKALDEYIEVPEQELKSAQRSGYTVVEWGGSEIK